MLNSFLEGKATNLIRELKSQRSNYHSGRATKIDDFSDHQDIANHFSTKYSHLYNKNGTSADLNILLDNLNINVDSMSDVDLVSPELVFQAISSINLNKSDNVYNFKSNAIINAADILTNHITILLQSFLIHGYVPSPLLTCSLKPIVKDPLGDKYDSENYRAIGTSSLLIKVLDWCVLILYEHELKPSQLQFGFQRKNSTTMCTWVVNETVNYFNNRNSPVFACFLDLSKAFDLINFSDLFEKLRGKISPIFIRLLSFIYLFQMCFVDWSGVKSKSFKVQNGVRQGAVLSPTLFCLYIDEIFDKLEKSGYGCFINKQFYGITGYADDLVLLSPSIYGLQKMLDLVNVTFNKLGLKLSVNHVNPLKSKTKCVAFGFKGEPSPIFLDGSPLPWSDSYNHLGHMLYKDGTLKLDSDGKRKTFLGSFFALKQELKYQNPFVYIQLIEIYLSHFYGSNLWNLFSIDNMYTTWNNILRTVFQLPQQTHRYLLEPLTDSSHLFTKLTNRFLKFYKSLFFSDKSVIRNLRLCQEGDCRSNFGKNISGICRYNGTDEILNCKKDFIKYCDIPDHEKWRIPILQELLDLRNNTFTLSAFSKNELNDLLFYVCCS